MMVYIAVFLASVLIASIAQVLLKQAARREHPSIVAEYLNPHVIAAYSLLFVSTLLTIFAYKKVPLSYGPILETTSYVYITFFGVLLFHEGISSRKVAALALIIAGTALYSFGVDMAG